MHVCVSLGFVRDTLKLATKEQVLVWIPKSLQLLQSLHCQYRVSVDMLPPPPELPPEPPPEPPDEPDELSAGQLPQSVEQAEQLSKD